MDKEVQKLLLLSGATEQFMKSLQEAGFEEPDIVTALNNACIIAVARTRGAAGAASWLQRIAETTLSNAAEVDQIAGARA